MKKKHKMEKLLTMITVAMLILLMNVSGASVISKFQITTDFADQRNPAIYGNMVVWMDQRNGNADIHGYNLSTGIEVQVTTDPHDQRAPKIHGYTVVWRDERNGHLYQPEILKNRTEYLGSQNIFIGKIP
jgi:beta propeller repeat protein